MTTRPTAVFMAFGTKGDVYPIAAIASAFASDQPQYEVVFVTHSSHQNLTDCLRAKGVSCYPVSSPPVLSSHQYIDSAGTAEGSFPLQKKEITRIHRQECVSIVERIFGARLVVDGDLIIINFFALEGWSLAELFRVHCVVTAPYVVPYSAPSSFECQFKKELPILYRYLREAPTDKIGWEDVIHWLWPLFSEDWGIWRSLDLQLSFWPFMDPVTDLPALHDRPSSPLLLYGFSEEIVECPGYWPSKVRTSGFWFLPAEWQFSCNRCADISSLSVETEMCSEHAELKIFLESSEERPLFISLSSIGSMGYLNKPYSFLHVLGKVSEFTTHRFLLLTAGYEPLDAAIKKLSQTSPTTRKQMRSEQQDILFGDRVFCFSGDIPYSWLFPKCTAAIHHGGSGSTAAALYAGIPQIICPFILDQFYWAERMFWLGVGPEPLSNTCLLPDKDDALSIKEAALALADAITYALSQEVRSQASKIAKRLSTEDGVSKAVELIKEEMNCVNTSK